MQLQKAENIVWDMLHTKLPGYLYYHGVAHTENVIEACLELATHENISDEIDLTLLKTAALFHDCGFVSKYDDHESEGCQIAKMKLPECGYTQIQIDIICKMILTTKLPQSPDTILEKILCDADLYYLGSDNFADVAEKLCKEWIAVNKVSNEKEWNEAQLKFLESHSYWTKSAKKLRSEKKFAHLKHLKESQPQAL